MSHFLLIDNQNPGALDQTLRNVSPGGTAYDRALLLTLDGAGFLQVIGQVGDTTNELTFSAGTLGACRNAVRDRAAA